jgi:hypothetical protein
MLANASLDVAMHDLIVCMSIPLSIQGCTLKLPQRLSESQLAAFTVGLIDGDGCLQVNHWRKKSLQFRLAVCLSDKYLNYSMLYIISLKFGGYVRRVKKKKDEFVLWVINDKTVLKNSIIPLLEQYPPLTSRMRLQYYFFKKYMLESDVTSYLLERDLKYNNRDTIIPLFTFQSFPAYFSDWLAGFIEAEGCFCCRIKGNYSFTIALNHDSFVLESIREFYNLGHLSIGKRISKLNGNPLYVFSIGSAEGTGRVIDHCKSLLQGYKYYQLAGFVINSKVFQNRFKDFFFE